MTQITQGKKNNLNLIQFVAALLVIYSHAFPIATGMNDGEIIKDLTNSFFSVGDLAVAAFFIISGFLVSGSYERTKSFPRYLKMRVLRIFPEMLGVLLISMLLLGPCVTTLPLGEYFRSGETWAYLKNFFLYPMTWTLPGVFTGNAYASSVNGSLWTLAYQFGLYVMLGVIGALGLLRYRKTSLGLLVTFSFLHLFQNRILSASGYWMGLALHDWFYLGMYFTAGMCAYAYRDQLRLDARGAMLSLLALTLALLVGQEGYQFMTALFGTYLILYAGYALKPVKVPLSSLSYGIYIYSFPLQQLWTYLFGGHMNPYLNIVLTIPCALALAWLSQRFIAQPAMKLRNLTLPVPEKWKQTMARIRGGWIGLIDRLMKITWKGYVVVFALTLVLIFPLCFSAPTALDFSGRVSGHWLMTGWYDQDPMQDFRFVMQESELVVGQKKGMNLLSVEGFLPENFTDVHDATVFIDGVAKAEHVPLTSGQSFRIQIPLTPCGSIIPRKLTVRLAFDAVHQTEEGSPDVRLMSACITSVRVMGEDAAETADRIQEAETEPALEPAAARQSILDFAHPDTVPEEALLSGWHPQDPTQGFRFVARESEAVLQSDVPVSTLNICGFVPDTFTDVKSVTVYINGEAAVQDFPLTPSADYQITLPLKEDDRSWTIRLEFSAAHAMEPGSKDIRELSGCITSMYVE